jgi:hypothetical protein
MSKMQFSSVPSWSMLSAMTKFVSNPSRLDPYKNFKFRAEVPAGAGTNDDDKNTVPRLPERRVNLEEPHAEKSPGREKYEPITVDRGVTHDSNFENWSESDVTDGTPATEERNPTTDHFNIERED